MTGYNWSPTPYNRKSNVLSASLNKTFPFRLQLDVTGRATSHLTINTAVANHWIFVLDERADPGQY